MATRRTNHQAATSDTSVTRPQTNQLVGTARNFIENGRIYVVLMEEFKCVIFSDVIIDVICFI